MQAGLSLIVGGISVGLGLVACRICRLLCSLIRSRLSEHDWNAAVYNSKDNISGEAQW